MKRRSLLLSLSMAVCVCLAGCGDNDEDTNPQPPGEQPTAPEQPGMNTPPEQGQTEEEDGTVQAQGKTCTVTCTVQNYGTGTCPASITFSPWRQLHFPIGLMF
ncbi:hypothetical protein ACN28E_10235 [Archangium lansingense]|uniref:hypothetical protein n=1 Tax=Archangium lansingense TaxID=2995310 RepID=UPI003B7E1861